MTGSIIRPFVASLMVFCVAASVQCGDHGGQAYDQEEPDPLLSIVMGGGGSLPELSGLQIVTLKEGRIDRSLAYGFAGMGPDGVKIPLRTDHKVRVASISKLVAAIGVMRLVDQGKIELKGDVQAYLPIALRNPTFPEQPITTEQLLSHTSSVRDGDQYWLPTGQTLADFFPASGEPGLGGDHFARTPKERPGHFFRYSNLNFGLLAGVIETVSGQRFDRYMRSAVFTPLGLDISYSPCDITSKNLDQLGSLFRRRTSDEVWDPDLDWQVQVDGPKIRCHYGMRETPRETAHTVGETELSDYRPGDNPVLHSPQGGLRASAEDLATLLMLLNNGGVSGDERLLSAEAVADMLTTRWTYDAGAENGITTEDASLEARGFGGLMTRYGLSVHIIDLKDWGLSETSHRLYGHLGEAYGLLGQAWLDPVSGDGLVALITGTGDNPARYPGKTSPLYGPGETILRWWVAQKHSNTKDE